MTLAVVDYGAGNLRSVGGALDVLGAAWRLAKGPEDLEGASAVLLPGVGSAGSAMRELERRGFPSALREPARPLLGICLGLQLLFEGSEEEGGVRCLGILPGRVRRLEGAPRLPHMGWNMVRPIRPHALFPKADAGEWFYFAHSYLCESPAELTLAETTHGETFAAAIGEGAICGVQFHPEKSGAAGLGLLAGFLSGAGVSKAPPARSTGTG